MGIEKLVTIEAKITPVIRHLQDSWPPLVKQVVPQILQALHGGFREQVEWVKKIREQGAWGQIDQGAGSKGRYFREQGAEDSRHFIKFQGAGRL